MSRSRIRQQCHGRPIGVKNYVNETTVSALSAGMDTELKQLIGKMTGDLQAWLDKPSPAARKIDHLRDQLGELKAELGAGVLGDTLKQLEKAEAEAGRLRQREAAEAIAELCRPLGVTLEAKEPPKRKTKTRQSPKKRTSPPPSPHDGSPKGQ